MKKPTINRIKAAKLLVTISSVFLVLTGISFGEDIEFFEKKYGTTIEGVEPISEYPDPDKYYRAIAEQLGILDKAYTEVHEKFGWENGGNHVLSDKLSRTQGGLWHIVIVRLEVDPETRRPDEKMMKEMELMRVLINDDGEVTTSKIEE